MNNIIRRIEVYGFRSLDSVQIICVTANVFAGLNDIGKTNILRALNLFFNGETDLGIPIHFVTDYSKLSLAKAQKSSKKKQRIRIRLFFNAPQSFPSLKNTELWVERTYDRSDKMTERSSLDSAASAKKAALTRLVNSIRFFFVPALKGANVLEFILGEIGKRNVMSSSDIVNVNGNINRNLSGLAKLLNDSSINIDTSFELPILVKDFWQRLNINTSFDEFAPLNNLAPSPKGSNAKLREELYRIPLTSRGEGLKSKLILPLLKWIQENEPKKFFIWGIDEPENSLEFKKAQEVADLYFKNYSKDTQLFLTSHSLAFIFPQNETATVFRCTKTGKGDIEVRALDDLFQDTSRAEVANDLGVLEIQREVIQEWRKKEEQQKEISSAYNKITRPTIYVEGPVDKAYWDRVIKLFGSPSGKRFDIVPIGEQSKNGKEKQGGGSSVMDSYWRLKHLSPKDKTVILLYNHDCNKEEKKSYDVVQFSPAKRSDQATYETGIEHLIIFPNSFNPLKYQEQHKKGDNITTSPDKQKIKDYLFGLTDNEQKRCFNGLNDILTHLVNKYI